MIIDFQHVYYRRNKKAILADVTWQVKENEHWVILGLNGAGKTTLLNMLNGYIFPSEGSVKVLEYSFGESIMADLRRSIGWISNALQQDIPPNDTTLEIVLSGKFASIGLWDKVTEEDIRDADEIITKLGITDLRDRAYSGLSQGERQKVLIGRALINDPRILIFDEACNGLDIFAKKEVYQQITMLSQEQKTILFVTHNTEEILPIFNKALLLKNGEIHSQGQRNNVIELENLQDFYGADVEVFEHEDKFFIFAK